MYIVCIIQVRIKSILPVQRGDSDPLKYSNILGCFTCIPKAFFVEKVASDHSLCEYRDFSTSTTTAIRIQCMIQRRIIYRISRVRMMGRCLYCTQYYDVPRTIHTIVLLYK